MQFGFERSSNVGNLNLGCMSDQLTSPGFSNRKVSNISGVASVFPTLHLQRVSSLRAQTDTLKPSGAELFKWLHLVQMKGKNFRFLHHQQRLKMPITISCSLEQLGFYFELRVETAVWVMWRPTGVRMFSLSAAIYKYEILSFELLFCEH